MRSSHVEFHGHHDDDLILYYGRLSAATVFLIINSQSVLNSVYIQQCILFTTDTFRQIICPLQLKIQFPYVIYYCAGKAHFTQAEILEYLFISCLFGNPPPHGTLGCHSSC